MRHDLRLPPVIRHIPTGPAMRGGDEQNQSNEEVYLSTHTPREEKANLCSPRHMDLLHLASICLSISDHLGSTASRIYFRRFSV